MTFVASEPSSALRAANDRLLALRLQHQSSATRLTERRATEAATAVSITPLPTTLPQHLGWGSEPLTAALRYAQQRHTEQQQQIEEITTPALALSEQPQKASQPADFNKESVKLYPDIGLAMLRHEQTAPGRLWLLLRLLDEPGRGNFRIARVRSRLTQRKSATYLCGWRQLRNLLREGEGLYWTRDKEHIWLRSAAKVAQNLGVERLSGRPVALSAAALLNGIGRFRAELYAAFHSGRIKVAPNGAKQAAPIARETLKVLSGVGETTQRRYEQQLRQTETAVTIQPNFAVGQKASQTELKRKAWQQGHALFILKDSRGQQGPKGEQYVAWQLPNSYQGSHQQCPKGRQRRINRQLAHAAKDQDLVMKGMPGNGDQTTATVPTNNTPDKLYYPTGKLAARAFNRHQTNSCYWRERITRNGRYAIWQHLEPKQ
jgi:hypothetical protein